MRWKFWKKEEPEILAPVYGVPAGMEGRMRHFCAHGCGGIDVTGNPEDVADQFNSVTAAEVYFETPGLRVTPDDVIRARQEK